MIVITFAIPDESRDIRRAMHGIGRLEDWTVGKLGAAEVLLAHTGVGHEAARASVARVLARRQPRCVIAAGFAGALDPSLRVGDVIVAENFTTPALLACCRFPHRLGALTSQPHPVESAAAKRSLAAATGALAVDMETAAIAAECTRAGVPLLAVRAISDAAAEPLPVPFAEWFDMTRQHPRPLRLLRHLARHPSAIGPFVSFLRGLPRARAALGRAVCEAVAALSGERREMRSAG